MYRDVTRYVKFITKHKLTQEQFLFLYCLKFNEHEAMKIYKEAFPTDESIQLENRTMIGDANKKDLIDRGFIRQAGKNELDTSYEITEKFNSAFLSSYFTAADEMWMAYPSYADIQGKKIPLCTMDRYQHAQLYTERIKFSVEEHLEVIKDIQYGKENGLISSSIENFVRGEVWLKIRAYRKTGQGIVKPNLSDSF